MIWHALIARVGQAILVAWAIATLSFSFMHVLPGDIALRIAAARTGEDRLTQELADRIRREEGLDRPLPEQYGRWLLRLVSGDLGRSLVSRKPVVDEIAYHASFTLGLGFVGWLLSYVIAVPLGLLAGFRPGGWVDRSTQGFSVLLAATPTFLLGIALISAFALSISWLPPAGHRSASHMVLPCLTLALGLSAYSVRVVRIAVADVRSAFYLTYGEVRGLSPSEAFLRHGVRNAAIPVVTFMALQLAFVIDGFIVIETLFAYPGLGDLLVKSLLARDIPVVTGAGMLIGLMYAVANLAADLVCYGLDPRQRRWGTT
jgi:peptide/nickel transport system permease protein